MGNLKADMIYHVGFIVLKSVKETSMQNELQINKLLLRPMFAREQSEKHKFKAREISVDL